MLVGILIQVSSYDILEFKTGLIFASRKSKLDECFIPGIEKTPAASDVEADVEVVYVGKPPELDPTDPNYHYFAKIFENFKVSSPLHQFI